ncbi:hypothetical protein [Acetohalobium arabaticum]|uniref:Sulfotransferase n=1 Tax=Acetohalobium arabaticum (strain ATCC 49924 / DSM 5501 / Z-7288) TaxID=574087 RepID=D9QTP7_ACEAZ|nr:hypothetical protein [Acetohalobium arabaticum]ADL11811.1 hypothetical protein Acear_0261 [Acetohalobium arabaticum DSM 5501]
MHTKSLNVAAINQNLDWNFAVHYGVVEYLAGYDPAEAWNVRGISGRGGSSQKYFDYRQEKVVELEDQLKNSQELQNKLDDFLEECFTLFNAFRDENQQMIDQYLDKEFYFILGADRTGGTFMLKELSRALDWSYQNLHMSILHEHMPDFDIEEPDAIGWRKPDNYYYLLFQIVQFLVYINRVVPEEEYVVKKTRFSKCMQLIDYIFGDKAYYIVTVRHPAAINASRMETGATGEVVDDVKREGKRTLYLWQTVYREIVRDGQPEGLILPIQFGSGMDEFLADFFAHHNASVEPDKCHITERDYDYDFWTSDYVVNSMEWVRMLWQLHELEFPVPEEIL